MGLFAAGERLTADRANERTLDVLAGQIRVTDTGALSSETIVLTTPAMNLRANTTYTVELDGRWSNNTAADQFAFRIKETNIGGTMLTDGVFEGLGGGPYFARCTYTIVTTGAVIGRVYVATFLRVVGTTGTGIVMANSRLRVYRDGDSGIYTSV